MGAKCVAKMKRSWSQPQAPAFTVWFTPDVFNVLRPNFILQGKDLSVTVGLMAAGSTDSCTKGRLRFTLTLHKEQSTPLPTIHLPLSRPRLQPLTHPLHLLHNNLMIILLLQPTNHTNRNWRINTLNKNRHPSPMNRILARLIPKP